MNQNVRKITEGAMMVALIGVFMLIDRQFQGTFSSMFVFLLPLPMVYFGAKYGLCGLYFRESICSILLCR